MKEQDVQQLLGAGALGHRSSMPLLHGLLAWHSHSANRCHACTVRGAHLKATGCQPVMANMGGFMYANAAHRDHCAGCVETSAAVNPFDGCCLPAVD